MVVSFLRAKGQKRKDKSAEKGMHSVLQVIRGSCEKPMSRCQGQLGVLDGSSGGRWELGT